MVACPGGPILEIPAKGAVAERLSPGTIREEDFYEDFRVVKGKSGRRVLLACPRGKSKKGVCRGGQRILRIWHDRKDLRALLRRCKKGELSRDRRASIKKIMDDIALAKKAIRAHRMSGLGSGGGGGLIAPGHEAQTPLGRLGQFMLTSFFSVAMTVLVLKFVFPGVLGGAAAVPASTLKGPEDE